MNIKSILLTAVLLFSLASLKAAPVDVLTAEQVARNFWNAHHDKGVQNLTQPLQHVSLRWDAFYLFQTSETEGFVIIAADDRIRPVLAYSFHNIALRDSVGPEMAWWLDGWQQQIDICRNSRTGADAAVTAEWQNYINNSNPQNDPIVIVEPMLTTQWDQDEPYNDSCPSQSIWGIYTLHAATGCVATAMAQVMKYWEYPAQGFGSHSYYSDVLSYWATPFGDQFANFGATTYDWAHMPDVLTSNSSARQKAAVATLMYHCGVASDMIYGTSFVGGSGAFVHNIPLLAYGNALNGFIEYFGYSSNTKGIDREYYDDDSWTSLVRNELNARRPILYAGGDEASGGHCFVCDGYDADNRGHFNWGWSGEGDGFYALNHLAPGSGGTGGGTGTYDFSNQQQMLIGLEPHHDINDFGNVIRQFPYTQDFEAAPMGWNATTAGDYYYSWYIYDTSGCRGNYSAMIFEQGNLSSTDTLNSPFIVTPNEYTLQWFDRGMDHGCNANYKVMWNGTILHEATLSSTEWEQHEATFTVSEGDSLQLQFVYFGTESNGGMMIDDISITSASQDVAIGIASNDAVKVYPNPTSDLLNIEGSILFIELFDMQGKQVFVSEQQRTIDLGLLPRGTYLLRATSSEGVSLKKIIKK